jgi:hypothetical protein
MKSGDIIGFVVIGVVFLGFGWLMFGGAGSAPEVEYLPVDMEKGSIEVVSQTEDGGAVTLKVDLAAGGYVTIHESMSNAPAAIIGTSSYLEPGAQEVTISVDPAFTPGFKYITLLRVDDGDAEFEALKDLPVRVDGAVVRPDFTFKPEAVTIPAPQE